MLSTISLIVLAGLSISYIPSLNRGSLLTKETAATAAAPKVTTKANSMTTARSVPAGKVTLGSLLTTPKSSSVLMTKLLSTISTPSYSEWSTSTGSYDCSMSFWDNDNGATGSSTTGTYDPEYSSSSSVSSSLLQLYSTAVDSRKDPYKSFPSWSPSRPSFTSPTITLPWSPFWTDFLSDSDVTSTGSSSLPTSESGPMVPGTPSGSSSTGAPSFPSGPQMGQPCPWSEQGSSSISGSVPTSS